MHTIRKLPHSHTIKQPCSMDRKHESSALKNDNRVKEQNGQESFLLILQVIDYGKQIAAQLYLCLTNSVATPVGGLEEEMKQLLHSLCLGLGTEKKKEKGEDIYHVQSYQDAG